MRRYYRSEIPESSLASNQLDGSRAQLARQGAIGGGGRVERVTGDPDDIRLDVDYRGRYAERIAQELREVIASSDIVKPPYATVGASQETDAYYAAELVDSQPAQVQAPGAVSVGADLSKAGTRNTHWLAVDTTVSQPEPGHPFGNDIDVTVGLPADARRVRIVDATSEPTQRSRPDPVATVEAEHGSVAQYDPAGESIDDPIYLYDLEYDLQGDVDVGVWDTYGHDTIRDADGVVAWARVFDTGHEFDESALVLENGLLRLTIDEPTNADETALLEAEAWDPSAAGGDGAWTTISLPEYDADLDTDWQPADVDLTHIGQARIAAQVEFEAVAGANAGDVYAADVQLDRGHDRAFVTETSDGELPADLQALLEPIASESVLDPGVEQTLAAREEVRP
ncbi:MULTISPECIES: hypothetical protein [Haloferacaceae]|uniref:Uncharacterized protein n=1 Tax=Halorubrum glutamatedens TaxID=2707018 RepID=A0ABD5QTT2_9EURY|nr:hypothetical protein [Halobellus captivus]